MVDNEVVCLSMLLIFVVFWLVSDIYVSDDAKHRHIMSGESERKNEFINHLDNSWQDVCVVYLIGRFKHAIRV